MRQKKGILLVFLALIFLSAGVASAVTYSEKQFQTVPGQTFFFNFGGPVAVSDGAEGYFTIEARGDYFGKGPNGDENLDFDIDNIFVVNNVWFGENAPQIISWDTDTDKTWWKNTWTIPGDQLLAITTDSAGIAEVALYTGVGYNFDERDWAEVTLEYNPVPIPGAILLLGSGLIGLAGIRKKFKR